MKYSIIIPTLNEEKLLPKLLAQLTDHALRERYDYEIIISDGGSMDKTLEIAIEHSDVVKVHRESGRQNIAMGRNEGAKHAAGDILIFLNGDVILPDSEVFFNYIENKFTNSDYPAMTCRVKVFPEEEILVDKLFHTGFNTYFGLLNKMGLGMGRGECQIVRKKIFEEVGGYNISLTAGEDFDLFRRIRKLGRILYPAKLCVYESPRRFRKLGYGGVTGAWFKNGFSVLFKNKSISEEWEQVR